MDELNYRPNSLARGLRRGDTKTIGLVIPDNSNPFFAEVARVIEDVGFNNGYSVILCNSDNDLTKQTAYLNVLITKQVDGVIFIAAGSENEHLLELTGRNIPVVVVDRELEHPLADIILVDNELGGCEAVQYLVDLGHKKIACITGPSELTPSADRVKGYRRALEEAGIPVRPEYIVPGDFHFNGGEAAMKRLLELSDPPTAVFACNDWMAVGALRALRLAGKQTPKDVSIVGFDDIQIASAVNPPLTTIAQPIKQMATMAANLLIARMQNSNETPTQRTLLSPTLHIRESCAKLVQD
jgi:LacI family transcriptional regulator